MKKARGAKQSLRSKQPMSPAIAEVLSNMVTQEESDDESDQQRKQPFASPPALATGGRGHSGAPTDMERPNLRRVPARRLALTWERVGKSELLAVRQGVDQALRRADKLVVACADRGCRRRRALRNVAVRADRPRVLHAQLPRGVHRVEHRLQHGLCRATG